MMNMSLVDLQAMVGEDCPACEEALPYIIEAAADFELLCPARMAAFVVFMARASSKFTEFLHIDGISGAVTASAMLLPPASFRFGCFANWGVALQFKVCVTRLVCLLLLLQLLTHPRTHAPTHTGCVSNVLAVPPLL